MDYKVVVHTSMTGSDCMSELGVFPCKAEPDIWMCKPENTYEYTAVYVDDLAIAMKLPKEFVEILEQLSKSNTKVNGLSPFILLCTSSGMKTRHCASHQASTLRN
jgi:hypothetical protein